MDETDEPLALWMRSASATTCWSSAVMEPPRDAAKPSAPSG
jgi:hypothetical protein